MALPIAHTAVALGTTRSRDPLVLVFLALLSIFPDFDFVLVWGFGFPVHIYHRTFSHSLLFAAALALLWVVVRPPRLQTVSSALIFLVLFSHSLVDMICTADVADHGVMLFWPFSRYRSGWPILVPLYLVFGSSPFSLGGAFRFTLLEIILATPLWFTARSIREGVFWCADFFWRSPFQELK